MFCFRNAPLSILVTSLFKFFIFEVRKGVYLKFILLPEQLKQFPTTKQFSFMLPWGILVQSLQIGRFSCSCQEKKWPNFIFWHNLCFRRTFHYPSSYDRAKWVLLYSSHIVGDFRNLFLSSPSVTEYNCCYSASPCGDWMSLSV